MKDDTAKYITRLEQAAFRNIMITGDNIYTAAKCGQNLKFGPENYLFLKYDEKNKFYFEDYNDTMISKLDIKELPKLVDNCTLCVEGPPLAEAFDR